MTRDYRSRDEIDDALRQLAGVIETPPPPDYAAQVARQLDDEAHARRHAARRLFVLHGTRRLLLAAAAVILLSAGVVAIVPSTRHTLASWLGFSGIDIRSAPATATFTPPTTPAPLDAGRRVTLAAAQRAAADRIALPQHLPAPRRVYLRRDGTAVVVTFAYRSVPSLKPTPATGYALIVTEIFDAGEPVFEKMLYRNALAQRVRVHDHAGVYVRGPQEIMNIDRAAASNGLEIVHEVAPRASADSLIWSDRAATYRLEGDFSRHTGLILANSLS